MHPAACHLSMRILRARCSIGLFERKTGVCSRSPLSHSSFCLAPVADHPWTCFRHLWSRHRIIKMLVRMSAKLMKSATETLATCYVTLQRIDDCSLVLRGSSRGVQDNVFREHCGQLAYKTSAGVPPFAHADNSHCENPGANSTRFGLCSFKTGKHSRSFSTSFQQFKGDRSIPCFIIGSLARYNQVLRCANMRLRIARTC